MKSTERHELAQNELAEVLGRTYQRIKPYLIVGVVAVLVIVVVIVWTAYSKSRAQKEHDQAITSLVTALRAGDLTEGDAAKVAEARIAALESFVAVNQVDSVGRLGQSFLASEYMQGAVLGLARGVADKAEADKVRDLVAKARAAYDVVAKGKDSLADLARYDLACLDATEAELDLRVAKAGGSSDAISAAEAKARKAVDALTEMTKAEKTTIGMLANHRLQSLKMKPLVFDKEPAKTEEKPPEAGEPKAPEQGGETKPAVDPSKTSAEPTNPAATGKATK